jgi:hypothetical protein
MKETFIIRTEWMDSILELDPLDQAQVFRNLFHFHAGEENLINLNNLSVKLVWKLIEPNLKRNIVSYDKRSLTSADNGRRGGRPKSTFADNQEDNNLNNLTQKPIETKEPIESLSVSVSDSDSVSVSDSELKNQATVVATEKKIDIPSDFPFQSEYAKQAMRDYISHRRQLKVKPYTKIGLERAMKEWEQWGEAVFIEAVNNTISKNYQGIFHPKDNSNNNKNGYTYTPQKITGRVEPAPHGTPFGKL